MPTILALLFFSCINALAGGTSYQVKILSLKKTNEDRYTMTFQRIIGEGQKEPPVVTLRLRHNEYYYTKKKSSTYTKETYRDAIKILKGHFNKGRTFFLGAMGGVWGIPVKGSKNEYWVQTLANLEESNGVKVVYTFKE